MKTLVTSGCSYTSYHYPCWDLWLGSNYNNHLNFGLSGTGPKYSYIQIRDYFKYAKNINPKDHHVIVQWSSLIRHDQRQEVSYAWKCGGQITNNVDFSLEYLNNHFTLLDVTCDLLYYIESLISLSKELGFKLHMLYMFEPWIDRFYGEPVSPQHPEILQKQHKGWSESKYLKSLKEHYQGEYFFPLSIESSNAANPKEAVIWWEGEVVDHHPSPLQHLEYSRSLSKFLNIKEYPDEWLKIATKLENIFRNTKSAEAFKPIFYNELGCYSSHEYCETPGSDGFVVNNKIELVNKCIEKLNNDGL